MPAVSADPITLPRLTRPAQDGTTWRGVQKVVTAHKQLEGEGFQVRRPFPGTSTCRWPTRSCCSTTWARWSTRRGRPRARPGTRTAASRP